MAKFDGAILNGIRDLQAGHDLTRCETANLEFLVGHPPRYLASTSPAP